MGALFALTATLALFSISSPTANPTGSDQEGSEIVVTGRKAADPKIIRSAVRALGHQLDVGGGDYQMARWIDPVCPVVLGLSASDAKRLEDDVKAVAAKVGAPVAGDPCQRNIEIIITSDPRSALLDEQSRQPWFFRGIPKADVATIIGGSAPIRWGSVTKTYSADGTPMRLDGSVSDADGSRLHAASQTGLGRMIVIVDREKTAGLPLDTLHDYIALVTLAQLNMNVVPTKPETILNATCGDADKGGGLRPFDIAYLKALYSVGPALHGSAQQAAMTRQVAFTLAH